MKKLSSFEFQKQGSTSFYDWDKMLDGSVWVVEYGELRNPLPENASVDDVHKALLRFRRTAYAAARVRDLALNTQVDGSSIVIQAIPRED